MNNPQTGLLVAILKSNMKALMHLHSSSKLLSDDFRFLFQVFMKKYFVDKNLFNFYFTEDRPIKIQMWDTAGQERFACLLPTYIRDSTVALIVYDITKRKSFDGELQLTTIYLFR